MILPPKPRFHLMLWAQLIAAVMVASGIVPYWVQGAVSNNILWRVAAIFVVLIAMYILPQIPFIANQVKAMGSDELDAPSELENSVKAVRRIIWYYSLLDLGLLTYLVHITGGITGSMYAGLYLLVPSLALLLALGSEDIGRGLWLISLAVMGIGLSFWMSHFGEIEFDAAESKHAFDIAMAVVSAEGAILLLVQVAVLKYQFDKLERTDRAAPPE